MQFWKREVRFWRVARLLASIAALTVIGLSVWERSSRPAYHALEPGMTEAEIRGIMGEPRGTFQATWYDIWYYRADGREDGRHLELLFDDGQLAGTGDKNPHWSRDYVGRMLAP